LFLMEEAGSRQAAGCLWNFEAVVAAGRSIRAEAVIERVI